MRVRHLALHAADPDALRPFYAETLGLPVVDTAGGFAVALRESALEFRVGAGDPTYHVALSIPGGAVDAAADWLAARTDLLRDGERERFRWDFLDADALYFADPAGNVLELLAPDGRAGPADPFGPDSLLDVAEVGVVTRDVPDAAASLRAAFDLPPSTVDESFAYLGDGPAFVVASPGREWYPTDRCAEPHPVTAVVEGASATVSLPEGPVAVVGVDG